MSAAHHSRSLFTDGDCPVCQDSSQVRTIDLGHGSFLSACSACDWFTGCDDSVDLSSPSVNRWVLEPYEGGPCLDGRDHFPVGVGFNKVGLIVSQCRICQKQGVMHYNGNDMNSERLDDVLFGAIHKMLGVDQKDPEFLENPSVSEMSTEEGRESDAGPLIDTAGHHLLVPTDSDIVCDCGNNVKECFQVIDNLFGEPALLKCFQCDALFCCDDKNSCASYIVCEKCGNSNEDVFNKTYSSCGDLVGVKCLNCRAEVRFGKVSGLKKNFSDSNYIHKAPISSWDQLEHGNHISWQRVLSYEHHAIVVSVDRNNNRLRVIEYGSNCDSIAGKLSLACVQEREEKIERFDAVSLYRYDYDPENCFEPKEVVARAKSREGERKYNILLKNCEHFATWCKTGKDFCSQIVPMTRRALHTVVAFINQLRKPVIDLIRQKFFKVIVAGASVDDVVGLAAELNPLGRIGGTILLNLLVELAMFCYNYVQLKKDFDKGMVDKAEFQKQVFQLGGESVGGLLLGLLLGFSWILLGPGILATVATVILNILGIIGGRFLGAWLGRKVHKQLLNN